MKQRGVKLFVLIRLKYSEMLQLTVIIEFILTFHPISSNILLTILNPVSWLSYKHRHKLPFIYLCMQFAIWLAGLSASILPGR